MVASGPHVRAVGWLAVGHDFPRGAVTREFGERLAQFASRWFESVGALRWGIFMGGHACELCAGFYVDGDLDRAGRPRLSGRFCSSGNFGVPSGLVLFVCPQMISHYVSAHAYCPPPAFVDAVMRAPLPGTAEYNALVSSLAKPERVHKSPDQEFYDLLGDERDAPKCRRDGCERGAITQSLLCRRHHYESYRGRPCPFDD